ncbi:MAG: phosphotransferase [Phycisphaerales bacterium]|nr:phosphotransferase [Phycisphaerales bacterium]
MHAQTDNTASEIARAFGLPGSAIGFTPHGGGHIHRSFVLRMVTAHGDRRYFAQQINTFIFERPAIVSANIVAVTAHIRRRLAAKGAIDLARGVLNPLRTLNGEWACESSDGRIWRVFDYIEGAATRGAVCDARDAYEVGAAFGEFQALLADYSGPPLIEVLSGFHDTPARLRGFDEAVRADCAGRAAAAAPELRAIDRHRRLSPLLMELAASGAAPIRIVHNDAKISNVLFDANNGARLCVVDLDIVMPGLSLFDFGDMLRSSATLAAEDEPDVSRVNLEVELFEAIIRGYLSMAGSFLLPIERAHLVTAGLVITFEQALRFLSDYLNGDRYYTVTRTDHNLHRARTQLALLEQMARRRVELERIAMAC